MTLSPSPSFDASLHHEEIIVVEPSAQKSILQSGHDDAPCEEASIMPQLTLSEENSILQEQHQTDETVTEPSCVVERSHLDAAAFTIGARSTVEHGTAAEVAPLDEATDQKSETQSTHVLSVKGYLSESTLRHQSPQHADAEVAEGNHEPQDHDVNPAEAQNLELASSTGTSVVVGTEVSDFIENIIAETSPVKTGREDQGRKTSPSRSTNKESRRRSRSRSPAPKPSSGRQSREGRSAPVVTTRVYVGNIPRAATWQDLKNFMKKAGKIVQSEIITDDKGHSKGCGIIEFETVREARNAIEIMNDTTFDGKVVHVRVDREPEKAIYHSYNEKTAGRQVFVGNLARQVNSDSLKAIFKEVGHVIRAQVQEVSPGHSKGCGLILFETKEAAQEAISKLDGVRHEGRTLLVRLDRPPKSKEDESAKHSTGGGNSRGRPARPPREERPRQDDRRDGRPERRRSLDRRDERWEGGRLLDSRDGLRRRNGSRSPPRHRRRSPPHPDYPPYPPPPMGMPPHGYSAPPAPYNMDYPRGPYDPRHGGYPAMQQPPVMPSAQYPNWNNQQPPMLPSQQQQPGYMGYAQPPMSQQQMPHQHMAPQQPMSQIPPQNVPQQGSWQSYPQQQSYHLQQQMPYSQQQQQPSIHNQAAINPLALLQQITAKTNVPSQQQQQMGTAAPYDPRNPAYMQQGSYAQHNNQQRYGGY